MKTIIKLFINLFKAVFVLLIIALLTPALYFAWRAGQPMDLPEFKGLTYYQFIEWRKMAYHDLAAKYQIQHPDENVSLKMCEGVDEVLAVLVTVPQTGIYTLAALNGVEPSPSYPLPTDVTLIDFLPKWWSTFEVIQRYNVDHYKYTSTPYCRIQPNIPTPEELEAMKLQREMGD